MALVPHRYTHFDSDLEDYMTDTDYYWVDCTQEDVAKFGPDAVASYIVNGKVSPEATKLFKHDAAGEITLGSIALSMCVAGGLAYSSVSSIEAGAPTIFAASLLSTIPGGFGGFFAGIARDTSKGYDPIIRMQARHQTHQLKKLIGTNHEAVTSAYYEIYRHIDKQNQATIPPYRLSYNERKRAIATILDYLMDNDRDITLAYQKNQTSPESRRLSYPLAKSLEERLGKAIDLPLAAIYAEQRFRTEKQIEDKATAEAAAKAQETAQREADKAYAELKDEEVSRLLGYRNAQELTDLSEL